MDTSRFTPHHFGDLPLGTRFVWHDEFWVKLSPDCAQNDSPDSDEYRRIHFINARAGVWTA